MKRGRRHRAKTRAIPSTAHTLIKPYIVEACAKLAIIDSTCDLTEEDYG